MLFNSFSYAVFLPVVFALYWIIPNKYRWILLLISSYYFYMSWNPKYVVLILGTTVVSYLAGIFIERAKNKAQKKLFLFLASVVCLGVLFVFKYFNFAIESFCAVLKCFSLTLQPTTVALLLPVGISFYTFQTLSYVIDVYNEKVEAEYHFGYYATFISFFPQLVAGPIERTSNLLPQIKNEHRFDYDEATYGLKLMAWGFFKKIVIADNLAAYVSQVFDNPHDFTGFALVIATVFFTFQIYCDFSGYSDIAIGTAKLLGINLMTNFKSPYLSQSIKEFWGRWHISLSTWFRDYIYIPLGGNRCGKFRQVVNLLITFLVSGLWHGANWTFVLWGGVHGAGQVIENAVLKQGNKSKGLIRLIRIVFVFAFAAFAWIFFVSNSVGDAFYVITHMLEGILSPENYINTGMNSLGITNQVKHQVLAWLSILLIFDIKMLNGDAIKWISERNVIIRWIVYIALIMGMFFYAKTTESNFVYFQF